MLSAPRRPAQAAPLNPASTTQATPSYNETMRFRTTLLLVAIASAGFGDTLTLRSGQVVNGTYLGGSARTIKMEVGDAIQTYDVTDIATLEFTTGTATAPAAASTTAPTSSPAPTPGRQASSQDQTDAQNRGPLGIDIPAGTAFTIRMIDAVDSETNNAGQAFHASLDEPVVVNGQTVIERGADAVVKLVDNKQSGKLTGTTQLALALVSVSVNGTMANINTQSVTQTSSSRGARTAKMAGGGAALGAIIGAIAGGGKGAAIGAGAGAAAGTGAEIATKGQRVHVPSETRLTFVVDSPIHL